MAAGEYVSVSSQADTERADLSLERRGLDTDDAGEHRACGDLHKAWVECRRLRRKSPSNPWHMTLWVRTRVTNSDQQILKARPL